MSAEIEDAFVALVKAAAGVTALIGSGDSARIYPSKLPQNPTYPCVMYRNVSPGVDNDLDGEGKGHARLRFSSYSRDYTEAKSLDTQLRLALHGVAQQTVASVPVGSIAKTPGGGDFVESGPTVNDQAVHRIDGDYEAWYTLPTS